MVSQVPESDQCARKSLAIVAWASSTATPSRVNANSASAAIPSASSTPSAARAMFHAPML